MSNSSSLDQNRRQRERQYRGNTISGITVALGAVAAAAGAAYYYFRSNKSEVELPSLQIEARSGPSQHLAATERTRSGFTQIIRDNLLSMASTSAKNSNTGISKSEVPNWPCITNTNGLLTDIYKRFVALKSEDCDIYYEVFSEVFNKMQIAMKEVDPYYNRYSSKSRFHNPISEQTLKLLAQQRDRLKQFAGSHFDHLRIMKPSEYDMDIAIDLPLNTDFDSINPEQSDLILEPKGAGYVQLKTGTQFKYIYKRDDVVIDKAALEWADDKGYLLSSKFISWFKSVVDKALNTFPKSLNGKRIVYVAHQAYDVGLSSSGPAITVCIKGPESFSLDVDFVPALRFPESRWPGIKQYRPIPRHCSSGEFMVVPKKNPAGSEIDKQRSWRLAMQDQEKKLMYNKTQMKQVIRLMKKFRDSNKMNFISSYYIKTLFFWEIENQPDSFWSGHDIAYLFRFMMAKLLEAVVNGNIPYFWNKRNNLINCRPETLGAYARVIEKVLAVLDDRYKYKDTAKYLLEPEEFKSYERILSG